jgi:putative ABC transport system ATP-binding protein
MEQGAELIRLESVTVEYRQGDLVTRALRDVSVSFYAGDYVSIVGPSGSGKSTLLAVLGLLLRITKGDYFLEGRNVTELSRREQAYLRGHRIGFIFQDFHLLPRASALDNVAMPLVHLGVGRQEREERGRAVLSSVDLQDKIRKRPNELSGGERQRVAIARALAAQPTILLADEPTGNLDLRTGRDVIELLESLITPELMLLTVTHNMELARRAKRRLSVVDGKLGENSQSSRDHSQ